MSFNRLGDTICNNQGCKMSIVRWDTAKYIDVQFEDGTIVCNKQYGSFKRGCIENPNLPSLFGIGYFGQGIYSSVDEYGNKTKNYISWYNMFKRCYSTSYKTYKNVSVCEEWKCFQNFAKWHEENYDPRTMQTWDLDKDILCPECKEYSPDNCAFVPHMLNTLFIVNITRKDKNLPSGIYKIKNKFKAEFRIKDYSNDGYLGLYLTVEEAEFKVNEAKENYIKNLINMHKENLDPRVYTKLKDFKINKLKHVLNS